MLREITLLDVDAEALYRPFETLSNGERTKVLLAALFLNEKHFLLIDEPTLFYEDVQVCEGVTFQLRRGERIAVTGKNGSGKSTLLKLICGEKIKHTGFEELLLQYQPTMIFVEHDIAFQNKIATGVLEL